MPWPYRSGAENRLNEAKLWGGAAFGWRSAPSAAVTVPTK